MNTSKIEKIILGTVQLGKKYGINNQGNDAPSREEAFDVLESAYERGIRYFDTADSYGHSKDYLKDFIKTHQDINILTKGEVGKDFEASVKTSLAGIPLKNLYCFSFHRFEDLKKFNDKELLDLKRKCGLDRLGVSVYTNQEFEEAIGLNSINVIQVPFNLIDNWSKRGELITKAARRGIDVHVRSIFLQGLFLGDRYLVDEKFKVFEPFVSQLKEIGKLESLEVSNLAMLYPLQFSEINKVLIGVDNVDQLECNLKFLDRKISLFGISEINNLKFENIDLLNPGKW